MVLRKEIALQIKDLLKENPQGLSITDIVNVVDINRNTAGRYLENLLVSGQVEMRRLGMAKIYMLSQRVPLSAVLSISSELVMQLDSSLRIIFANEPFLKLVGTDSKNLLGKNIEYTPVALVFDDLFLGFHENIREGLTGKEWSGEIALSTKDIIFFCRIAPTVFDDGRKGVSVLLEDITGEKRAEQTLQESEDRYRKLVEISPDAVIIHQQGKIIFINPATIKLLGASNRDEIVNKNVLDFIHPDFHESVRKNIEKDLGGDITLPLELQMLRIDGTSIIVEGRGVKTTIDSKPAVQVAIRDITERKRAEEELQKSEKQYRNLVETTGTGYVILDKAGRVIKANQEYVRLTGRSTLAEIEGRPVTDWTASYDLERNAREIEQCFRKGRVRGLEVDYQRPDGTIQPIEINASIIQSDSEQIILTLCRDITERKRAEGALLESEEKYRTLIDRANDGIIVVQDKIIKMCNRYITEFWGGSIEEMLGRPFTDFIHPDALSEVVDRYNRRMAGENPPSLYKTILKRKDGSRFYAELNAGIVSYEGKPANLIIIRDINERKKVEAALRESEDRYRTLAEASNDLIFVIGKDDRVEYVNTYASALVNKPVTQIIGRSRSSLFPPEVSGNQKKALEAVFETGTSVRNEGALTLAGRTHWFDHFLTPLKDADNHVRSVLGISRDITERKKADDALRESEEKYRTLINRANDVISIVQDGVIKMCNPRLAEFWGGSIKEVLGKPFTDFVHPEALPEVIDRYNRRMAGESPPSLHETVFMRKDGSKSYVELNAGIISYKGKNADLVIVREINERKKVEAALRESEQSFKRLLEQEFDAIAIHKEGKITFLNNRAVEILGAAKPEDLIGRSIFDFIHPDSRKDLEDRVRKLGIAEGMPAPLITEKFIQTDGTTVTIEVMAIRFDDNGIPAYRVAFREIPSQ